MIKGFRYSPFIISTVQPLSIERKQRPRSMNSEAVNTCSVFVVRKTNLKKHSLTIKNLELEFSKIVNVNFPDSLKDYGWSDEDISIGLMANGVAIITNSNHIENMDDFSALVFIENIIKQRFPEFSLSKRKSL